MNHGALKAIITAWALLAGAGAGMAGQANPPAAHGPAGPAPAPKPLASLIDLNSADKAQLTTLPGITETYADKIIAGRPYRSKANLVTHHILPVSVYAQIHSLVAAFPPGRKK